MNSDLRRALRVLRPRREERFHLTADAIGGKILVDRDVGPGQRLPLRDRTHQLHVVREAEGQSAEGDGLGQAATRRLRR